MFRCVLNFVFRPFEKWGGTLYPGVLVFLFFLFSTHNQLPQILMGMGRVMYQIKTLTVMIRATFKSFKNIFPVSRIIGLKFFVFSS